VASNGKRVQREETTWFCGGEEDSWRKPPKGEINKITASTMGAIPNRLRGGCARARPVPRDRYDAEIANNGDELL